ncbi:Torso-like protein, partial [Caligus rogercresseyi]
ADGVAQPYKLYTGSWRKRVLAKYMGLSTDSLDGESSFILVKLNKVNRIIKTQGNPILNSDALNSSVLGFINDFGSHYVKEVKVGDVIYQVFALSKSQFTHAKSSLGSYQRIRPNEFNALYEEFMAPWNVRETGTLQATSGDFRLKKFLRDSAQVKSKFSSYPSIFEFKNNPTLMAELEQISNSESEAVIGLEFGSLRSMIPSISAQDYFDEVVDTQMALWEINIS